MNTALKKLEKIVSELPAESQAEVVDFAEFLREKLQKQNESNPKKERVAGLHDSQGWISDDFNDELGDD